MDDLLVAFLDDLYAVTEKDRTRKTFDIVTTAVEEHAGIRTNLGKLQLYSTAGGEAPAGFEDFQDKRAENEAKIWTSDSPQPQDRGIVVLGSPLGSPEFCEAFAEKRMEKEQALLDWLPKLEDCQVAWPLLFFCAVPRANHILRLLPPSLSYEYTHARTKPYSLCRLDIRKAWTNFNDVNQRTRLLICRNMTGL